MNHLEIFEAHSLGVMKLTPYINATTPEEFISQFRRTFSCDIAKSVCGVVYVWYVTKDPIPRLRGESDIIYIGKTIATLSRRHRRYAELEGSDGEDYKNWTRYKHIIKSFGSIGICCAQSPDPRQSEKELRKTYFTEHLEYPPIEAGGK